jgi:hypothetical protein
MKGKTDIAMCVIDGKQETTNKEEVEMQFQELTTQTNLMQKKTQSNNTWRSERKSKNK